MNPWLIMKEQTKDNKIRKLVENNNNWKYKYHVIEGVELLTTGADKKNVVPKAL